MVAALANLLLFWNLTESSFLGAAPYSFLTSAVGYANFSFIVGGLVSLITAGLFCDWISNHATRRMSVIGKKKCVSRRYFLMVS